MYIMGKIQDCVHNERRLNYNVAHFSMPMIQMVVGGDTVCLGGRLGLIQRPGDVLGTVLSSQHEVRGLWDSDSPSVVCIGSVSIK